MRSVPNSSEPFRPRWSLLTSPCGCGRLDQAPERDRQEPGGVPCWLSPCEGRVIVGWLSLEGSVPRRGLRGADQWTRYGDVADLGRTAYSLKFLPRRRSRVRPPSPAPLEIRS